MLRKKRYYQYRPEDDDDFETPAFRELTKCEANCKTTESIGQTGMIRLTAVDKIILYTYTHTCFNATMQQYIKEN